MKRFLYVCVAGVSLSACQTAKVVYDDVYEAAVTPEKIDESAGYKDFIKDQEDEYKVVVDEKKSTPFGGYYSDKASVAPFGSGGNTTGSYGTTDHGDHCCERGQYYSDRGGFLWGNNFPGSGMCNNFAYRPSYNCTCDCCMDMNFDMRFYAMHYGNMGSNSLYGYYDYWGTWHSYYPGIYHDDPFMYGYNYNPYFGSLNSGYWYAGMGYPYYANGWNNYGWPYYGNGYYGNGFYGNNYYGNGGTNSNNEPTSPGNHFYGPRGSTTTGSSNTTEYAHTVKNAPTNTDVSGTYTGGTGKIVKEEVFGSYNNDYNESVTTTSTSGTERVKPVYDSGTSASGGFATTTSSSVSNSSANSNFATNTYSSVSNSSTTTTNGTTTDNAGAKVNHVVAVNPFAGSTPTYSGVSRTNSTTTTNTGGYSNTGTYGYDSQQNYDNSQYSSTSNSTGKYRHVVNTSGSTGSSTESSTSRSTSSERTSTTTNWNSTNDSYRSSGSNTTTGHRSSSTSSGSSSGNSGSSSSGGTSRR